MEQRIQKLEEQVSDIRVRQAEIHSVVEHIKNRIDNGMSHTLTDMAQKLDQYCSDCSSERAVFTEQLKAHEWWVAAIRLFIFMIAGVAITGGIFALFTMVPH